MHVWHYRGNRTGYNVCVTAIPRDGRQYCSGVKLSARPQAGPYRAAVYRLRWIHYIYIYIYYATVEAWKLSRTLRDAQFYIKRKINLFRIYYMYMIYICGNVFSSLIVRCIELLDMHVMTARTGYCSYYNNIILCDGRKRWYDIMYHSLITVKEDEDVTPSSAVGSAENLLRDISRIRCRVMRTITEVIL